MPLRAFSPRQRLLVIAGAALVLPALVALALQVNNAGQERRRAVERQAFTAARQIILLADARAAADLASLRLISGSPTLMGADLQAARQFGVSAVDTSAGWLVLVRRNADGRVQFSTRAGAARMPPAGMSANGVVEGVVREGSGCPCVWLHAPARDGSGRTLSLAVTPDVFQQMSLRLLPEGTVGALVDRDGDFIARSLNYADRVGQPASEFVRAAVKRGGTGLYRGRTLEGMENYSAYVTSEETGWSAHVALDAKLLDTPRMQFGAGVLLASLIALALAGAMVAYAIYDLGQRRREEEGLVALQKAEALGLFTTGVLHDIRNVLAVMQGALHLIARRTKEPETAALAEEGNQALQRGLRLSNQLLSFARNESPELRTIDLAACLEGMKEMLGRALGEHIALDVTVAPDARMVLANADQLELAFLNLALNARDAMDGEGRFTISASREGDMVAVRVADSGPGIPGHLRTRLFEPFFTTKAPGKGTGLGLAQVAGAVRQAGGEVEVGDAPGGGAQFTLRLRAGDAPA